MPRRALTVDDSRTMRDMVGFTLKNAGFEVLEAEDGRQALERLGSTKVDVILTDLNMPVMNAIELIRALRQHSVHRLTPILMLTTEAGDASRQDGKAAGATGWIVKPFSPEKLLQVVEKVCA